MAWVAIDAGTSVIKAVLFADDGQAMRVARRPAAVLHPQSGWSEQNMHEVWQAVVSTVREAVAGAEEPIRGIVSTAQGDGCWLVDARGEPTGNAILWNDGRASALVEQWREDGLIEESFRVSGSVTYAGLPNALLRWLLEHEPRRVADARWLLSCNGWLVSRMTGQFVADLSDGVNPFGDFRKRAYSAATLERYGLASQTHRLPPLVQGREAVWPLNSEAATAFGLPAGVPVVMAPYDIVATAYGAGAVRAGQGCVILGTTICAEVLRATNDPPTGVTGTSLPLTDRLALYAMPTLTGCEALQWAADTLGLDGVAALDALAATDSRRGAPPAFLPYLSPAGERAPFLAPGATGSLHGLTLATTRGAVARAIYEGLTFVVRECLETAAGDSPLREVRVCGGGARSDGWCQKIADVLGLPVIRPGDAEVGARGAHLFGLYATGESASVAEAADRLCTGATTFYPARELRTLYDEAFREFLHLRDEAKAQWRESGRNA